MIIVVILIQLNKSWMQEFLLFVLMEAFPKKQFSPAWIVSEIEINIAKLTSTVHIT